MTLLDEGVAKICKKFWVPANPVHQVAIIFTIPQKPSMDLIFFSFAIPTSSQNEKRC